MNHPEIKITTQYIVNGESRETNWDIHEAIQSSLLDTYQDGEIEKIRDVQANLANAIGMMMENRWNGMSMYDQIQSMLSSRFKISIEMKED